MTLITGKLPTIDAIIDLCSKENIPYEREWLAIVDLIIEKLYENFGQDIVFTVSQDYDPEAGTYDGIWLITFTDFEVDKTMNIIDMIDRDICCKQSFGFRTWFSYDVNYIIKDKGE